MKNFVSALALLFSFHAQVSALVIYKTGNPVDAKARTRQVNCLVGGGEYDHWADGWKYMMLNSGGGDVTVIRIDGERGDYEDWIYNDSSHNNLPKVNSVTVLSLEKPSDANDPKVVNELRKSELIFFTGGDQTEYIDWFHNSLLEKEIHQAILNRQVPIGGTSAGMALLAGIDFGGRFDSPSTGGMINSYDALMNPTAHFLDLDDRVIQAPHMKHKITDTHFTQRERHGRMMGFLAKALYLKLSPIETLRGIAADEDTAFCYNQHGRGRVFGKGQVYFFKPLSEPEVLAPHQALTWHGTTHGGAQVDILSAGTGIFDISNWLFEPYDSKSASFNALSAKKQFWSVFKGNLIKAN